MTNKLAVIGLDGATWTNLNEWVREGKLPLFEKLVGEGVSATLLSTIPPFTIPAWNVMMSGRSPGELGAFSGMQKVPGEYRWCPYYLLHEEPPQLWDYANGAGLKTLVMNVPNVHYPFEINGVLVVGWLFNDPSSLTYPEELKQELDRLVGGYEVDPGYPLAAAWGGRTYLDAIDRVNTKHCRALAALLRNRDFSLAITVIVGPDRSQHSFWFRQDMILEQYQKLEAGLEEILDALGGEYNVLFVSDHGFGPVTRSLRLNQWLVDEGYLVVKGRSRKLKGAILDTLKRVGLEPGLRRLGYLAPAGLTRTLAKRFEPIPWDKLEVDWSRTRAFNDSDWGYIYLNVKGREAEGIVDPDECGSLKDEIIGKLSALKDPATGDTIHGTVSAREEVYHGRCVRDAPDIVVQVNDQIPAVTSKVGYSQVMSRERRGHHRQEGILLGWGPDFAKGRIERPVEMLDVAPTVLHALGLPIPTDMEGEARPDLLAPHAATRTQRRCQPLQAPKRRAPSAPELDLRERLRAIGYLV